MAEITLFHAPNTRSSGTLILLEELDAPYELHVLNMKAGEQRAAAYLALNPLGKVPALRHGEALIAEQVACYLYLADLFPEAGLAPAIGDPLRGPYLRWMVLYSSCFEPAVVDRAMKRTTEPASMSSYGSFDALMETIRGQIAKGPYLFGEKITAADILWGNGLMWTMGFGLVPKTPDLEAYAARVTGRPSFAKVKALDEKLAKEHGTAVEAKG